MGQAKHQIEMPTTLEAALEVISQMQEAIAALEEQVEDDDYCANCSELEDALDDAEERGEALDRYIDDLVTVRHAIKRGTVNDDHLYRIETMLSHLDSGWMCRA